MNENTKQQLYDVKMGLIDLTDDTMMEGIKVKSQFVQKKIIFALEVIDDVIEGKIKFPKKN